MERYKNSQELVTRAKEFLAMAAKDDEKGERFMTQMPVEVCAGDAQENSITFAFDVTPSEMNHNNAMMGGITAAALDIACGVLCYAQYGDYAPPTAQMNVNLIKAIPLGARLLIKARIDHSGRRLANVSATATIEASGEIAATATMIFVWNKVK